MCQQTMICAVHKDIRNKDIDPSDIYELYCLKVLSYTVRAEFYAKEYWPKHDQQTMICVVLNESDSVGYRPLGYSRTILCLKVLSYTVYELNYTLRSTDQNMTKPLGSHFALAVRSRLKSWKTNQKRTEIFCSLASWEEGFNEFRPLTDTYRKDNLWISFATKENRNHDESATKLKNI